MPEDFIRYDLLAQAALRGVVRTVLADAAKNGLPGEHHFKITFATGAPGVRLSERMRAQYPETMTIILQHQFWDLVVREEAFDVGLSFGGNAEKLTVPFAAITAFIDPAVQFGFQFEMAEPEAAEQEATKAPEAPAKPRLSLAAEPNKTEAAPAAEVEQEKPSGAGAGAEVVSLDRFRKK
jgi:uncharacterized protein